MAKVFVDANKFIDVMKGRVLSPADFESLAQDHSLFLSALTIHIICYVGKVRIPDDRLIRLLSSFVIIPVDMEVVDAALMGPLRDFEDNVQIQSALLAECNYLLTSDKELLRLGQVGGMVMIEGIDEVY